MDWLIGPPKPNDGGVIPAFAAAAVVAAYAFFIPNSLAVSALNEDSKLDRLDTSRMMTITANPRRPPKKHHLCTFAYPAMPSETSRPASAIVISVTTNVPVCVPNHAAPEGSPAATHSGWKNSSDSTEP